MNRVKVTTRVPIRVRSDPQSGLPVAPPPEVVAPAPPVAPPVAAPVAEPVVPPKSAIEQGIDNVSRAVAETRVEQQKQAAMIERLNAEIAKIKTTAASAQNVDSDVKMIKEQQKDRFSQIDARLERMEAIQTRMEASQSLSSKKIDQLSDILKIMIQDHIGCAEKLKALV